jgi:nucleotide-binding universal stress UspA family protein
MLPAVRTIIVGYDDGEASRRALERAADVAAATGGELVVVTVAEVVVSPERSVTGELLDAAPVSIEATEPPDVAAALVHAREYLARRGVEADFLWAAGEPAATLLEVAKERDADLIVIGTHHESLLERLFGASVTDEVTHEARCDVLVVR